MTNPVTVTQADRDAVPQIELVTDDDHEYSFDCDADAGQPTITQMCFYEGEGVAIAIAEINDPNCYDDEFFDQLCAHLVQSWNHHPSNTGDTQCRVKP